MNYLLVILSIIWLLTCSACSSKEPRKNGAWYLGTSGFWATPVYVQKVKITSRK